MDRIRENFRIIALLICFAFSARAISAPAIINYQAKLTDTNGVPITSSVNLTFTFWDAVSGGNQLGNGFSDLDSVLPNSTGVVSTQVGDDPGVGIPSSVFASDSVWLNVNVNGNDLTPRERIASVGYAVNALPLYGQAHVISEVTPNASTNGLNLLAVYARAKSLTPNGQPLSADNRAVVLVSPGNYDLTSGPLTLDTEFVDVAGLSPVPGNQFLFGNPDATTGTGILRQTANDVHIENLRVRYTRASGEIVSYDNAAATAYYPDSGSTNTVVRNCRFEADDTNGFSMRLGIFYAGTYENCTAGALGFGSGGGTASGTFTNCTGGIYAFGSFGGTASGKFTNCAAGHDSFGSSSGTASGTFTNCTAGDWGFGSDGGSLASGTFTNCTAGSYSFGSYFGTATGKFVNCTAGTQSFGSYHAVAGGLFVGCTGGTLCFGVGPSPDASGGRFYHCNGGSGSFTETGSPAPLQLFCTVDNGSGTQIQYPGNN